MHKKSKTWYRTAVQIFFFILVALTSLNELLAEKGLAVPFLKKASLHAICPFGGVVSIYKFITAGSFVQKIHESSFVLMFIGFFLAILFGPVICGWVCPFGSYQEWIGKIGKKLFKKKYNNLIPEKIDQYMRYLRYGVLAVVIYITATTAKLVFQSVDPYHALFNFWSEEVSVTGLTVLGIFTVLALIIERPWCKYACPYGAVLGVFNLVRIFKIKRNAATCIQCKACDRACPMNIKVSRQDIVRNHQCISCLKCTSEYACPVKDTIELSSGNQ